MSDQKPSSEPYRVLARKYRPQNFSELIGQEALVRTLTNAIESGRVAHAFMLTGVRGVGKTTTARIIAKALNYKGPDGQATSTTGSTEDCALCQAISEDRHPDVIEMDAASRTGVDDIREILDGVRYAPTEARYKIYIIDEVHMLSKNAFNALLKTLEEPPPHVKFIFATTEIRKVPVTVLSRCQRFDLRRVDIPTLTTHFLNICEQEKIKSEEAAMALIARAADGSVRDGLSILDRALALCYENSDEQEGKQGDSKGVTLHQVEDLLGLSDRAQTLDLFENILKGDMPEALGIMDNLHRDGADPIQLIQDLLDITHSLTKYRAIPNATQTGQAMSADENTRMKDMAAQLSMPSLAKAWQILLKGLAEIQTAPNPQAAIEMVLIRLAYAGNLPDPADLLKRLQTAQQETTATPQPPASAPPPQTQASQTQSAPRATSAPQAHHAIAPQTEDITAHAPDIQISSLKDIEMLLEQNGEILLATQLFQYIHLVKLQSKGESMRLEINLDNNAPPKLAQDLGPALTRLTSQRWIVSVVSEQPQSQKQPTLAQTATTEKEQETAEILQMPIIKKLFETFPDAEIKAINHIDIAQEQDKNQDKEKDQTT